MSRLFRVIDSWKWHRIIKTKTAETIGQLRNREKDKRNLLRDRSLKVKVTKEKVAWYVSL